MTNDSIEAILDDATMSPRAYCYKYDCGHGVYDELADYVPDMCIHLVGRTEAVMRHNSLQMVHGEFHIGDRITRKNGRSGEVIGFAVGKNGKPSLVLSMRDGHWKTYLCPVDEARHLKVPTVAEVRYEIVKAIQDAADGSEYTPEKAEGRADALIDLAHACFFGEEFPVEDRQLPDKDVDRCDLDFLEGVQER